MSNKSISLADELANVRKELLDLGLRNPLLNFRPPRGKGLEVTHPDPNAAFRAFARDEKTFTFSASEAVEVFDADLRTSLLKDPLATRLLATSNTARSFIDEQGVNTLFLAFGMVKWQEQATDKFYRAPLVLVPAELKRADARHRFTLHYTGDEIQKNVSLIEKVKQEHGIVLPSLDLDEEIDLASYFAEIRRSIRPQEQWSVEEDAIVLSFFSFAKFLMYRDLDPATWEDGSALLNHPVLNSLMGDISFPEFPDIGDDDRLDVALKGNEPLLVDSADSSQTLALAEALAGRNLIVQGPPGTGKSQTIVNLIAAAVHSGKKVLFVSEKLAALDVVKRRLDKLNLGASSLELHSNKTKKRQVVDELRRTVRMARVPKPLETAEMSMLGDLRDKLNAYCDAVNQPVCGTGETPSSIYGKLLRAYEDLEGFQLPPVRFADSLSWSAEDTFRKRTLARRLRDNVQIIGPPKAHPFWGSQKRMWVATEREGLRRSLKSILDALTDLKSKSALLAEILQAPTPDYTSEINPLISTARQVVKAPELECVDVHDPDWTIFGAELEQLALLGERAQSARAKFRSALAGSAWDCDVNDLRNTYAQLGGKWWKFVSPKWRAAQVRFASLCSGPPPTDREGKVELLDAIIANHEAYTRLSTTAAPMAKLLGKKWRGADTDFLLVGAQVHWILDASSMLREDKVLPCLFDAAKSMLNRDAAKTNTEELARVYDQYSSAVATWRDLACFDHATPEMHALEQETMPNQTAYYSNLNSILESFPAFVSYNQSAFEAASSSLAPLVEAIENSGLNSNAVLPLFEKARLETLIEFAFQERPALGCFDGVQQNQNVETFRKQDEVHLQFNRAAFAARHCAAIPALSATGQAGVLAKEFERKTRFLPVRKLMEKAGNAIQAIKPVFMMSPLSIANYLPPGAVQFDIVIFDEASQVKPADALGTIVRAKQVVVVGDSKQLPPTSFFDTMVNETSAEAEDGETATDDIESILGLFSSRGARQKMLRWHYRSRHESLIAVSNRLFYDDGLVIFPSPAKTVPALGLKFRYLPNAFYDRGGKRNNPVEAKAVAQAVIEHASAQLSLDPHKRESLGVVAFSVAQMETILDELEILRKSYPHTEEFFGNQHHEPFFVKNLENVQGDERDIIFISIGYARTVEGYLAMNFGPLSRDGGERRLNVLISRAKRRCLVFSNLTADDIDLSRTNASGVKALKTFLEYAQTGRMDVAVSTGKGADSEFEEQVARALSRQGWQTETQVGCSGFFLDLAVVDPCQPGRYLLGIECDGAAYHSARSARDRDRLRQAVLEGLGWTIYRIWSTDWFKSPEEELRKMLAAIERASKTMSPTAPEPEPIQFAASATSEPAQGRAISARVYEVATLQIHLNGGELHLVSRQRLIEWIAKIVDVESPIHWLEAARRIAAAAGVQRVGNRIQDAISAASDSGVSQARFLRKGDFLWNLSASKVTVRDRSFVPMALKKIDLVAPEEIASAVQIVVQESFGVEWQELSTAVAKLIGFGRTSEDTRTAIEREARELVQTGALELQGDVVVCRQSEPSRQISAD